MREYLYALFAFQRFVQDSVVVCPPFFVFVKAPELPSAETGVQLRYLKICAYPFISELVSRSRRIGAQRRVNMTFARSSQ